MIDYLSCISIFTTRYMASETAINDSWQEQTGSLERILKALILDINRLNERVDCLEKTHGPRIDSVKNGLDILAFNIQGFETQGEALNYQRQQRLKSSHLNSNKLRTVAPTAINNNALQAFSSSMPPSITAPLSVRPQTEAVPKDLSSLVLASAYSEIKNPDVKRLRARQRWRWALMKIRMQLIRGRIPMTSTKVGRENSIAFRLEQVEGLVGRTDYKIRFISTHAGPDKVNKLMHTTKWLEETLIGGSSQDTSNRSGSLNRLAVLEQKIDAVFDIATAADTRSEQLLIDYKLLREQLKEAAVHAANASKDATYLRIKAENQDMAIKSSLPRARREAVGLTRALQNTCFAAMRSRDIALLPGCNKLMQGWLSPIYHQLESIKESLKIPPESTNTIDSKEITKSPSVNFDQWRASVLETARYLYVKLRDDMLAQKQLDTSTLKDVPINIMGEQAYNIDKDTDAGFIIEVVDKIMHARGLAIICAHVYE